MALINCPECNKEVSDKAQTCPNCGVKIKLGILQSMIETGKKQLPVVQETGKKYISKIQETGQKHIDSIQERFQNVQEEEHNSIHEESTIQHEQNVAKKVSSTDDDVQNALQKYYQNQQNKEDIQESEFDKLVQKVKSFFSVKRNIVIAAIVGIVALSLIVNAISSGRNRNITSDEPPPNNVPVQTAVSMPKPTPELTPEPPPPIVEIETGIIIEYDANLFLYIYNVRISVNDISLGIQEQGQIELYEMQLTEDIHTITFSEFGNDGNVTTDTFEVIADSYNYFFIKSRSTGIEIEKRDIMTFEETQLLLGVLDDQILATPEPAETPTPTPELSQEELDDILALILNTPGSEGMFGDVFDIVEFGTYHQNRDGTDSDSAIKWIVLEVDGNRALLLSLYLLDYLPYNGPGTATAASWEYCSLREWLNDTFINDAFSQSDQSAILKTSVVTDERSGENTTNDQIFLLSLDEAWNFFSSNALRQARGTEYAKSTRMFVDNSSGTSSWWLRTPADGLAKISVSTSGERWNGPRLNESTGVRPAMWVDMEKAGISP